MADAAQRLVELAEDRLRVAEELGLSAAGLFGKIICQVETDDLHDACETLAELDQLINEARAQSAGEKA